MRGGFTKRFTIRSPRGVALINALIIVAAISAISTALLLRTERATQRGHLSDEVAQTTRYLDAGTLLVRSLLDSTDPAALHLQQEWASPRAEVPIDRGTISWEITDLQGRFNLNHLLGDGENAWHLQTSLEQLALAQGLNPEIVRQLASMFKSPRDQRSVAIEHEGSPSRPPALPLTTLRELLLVPGMTASDFATIDPFLAALPLETALNVNTLDPEILAALAQESGSRVVEIFSSRRESAAFTSVEDFFDWVSTTLGPEVEDLLRDLHFTVTSGWFLARIEAQLGATRLQRSVVLTRASDTGHMIVAFHLPEPAP